MFEGTPSSKVFIVHCLCANCQRPSARRVVVPHVEGAPSTVDELIEALESNPLPFQCRYCDSLIGELVGITMEHDHAHA